LFSAVHILLKQQSPSSSHPAVVSMIGALLFVVLLSVPALCQATAYMELANGPSCVAEFAIKTAAECGKAAESLGYSGKLDLVGSWPHVPLGCVVGHPADGWKHTFFNSFAGQEGHAHYKSICIAPKPCVFPFTYGGIQYHMCTPNGRQDNNKWCATTANWDADRKDRLCLDAGGYECARLYSNGLSGEYLLNRDGGKTDLTSEYLYNNIYWNNAMSAVRVHSGCILKLYEEGGYRGRTSTYTAGAYGALRDSFNDKTSSYECQCEVAECKYTDVGFEYVGTKAVSANGTACIAWTIHQASEGYIDENFADVDIAAAKNYCRTNTKQGPWCDIDLKDPSKWAYCDIPKCKVWRDDGRCGYHFLLQGGVAAQCDANSETAKTCCSNEAYCGNQAEHCNAAGSFDYANLTEAPAKKGECSCGETKVKFCSYKPGEINICQHCSQVTEEADCHKLQLPDAGKAHCVEQCFPDIKAYTCPSGTSGGKVTWYSDGKSKSYADMEKSCSAKGERICSYIELCPAGQGNAPVGGQQVSDKSMWAPVSADNRSNRIGSGYRVFQNRNWVQVGKETKEASMCTKLTDLHHVEDDASQWWNRRDREVAWKQFYPCCKGRSVATVSGEINTGDVCGRPRRVTNARIYPENVNKIGLHESFTVVCNDGFSLPVHQVKDKDNEWVKSYMSPVMRCKANGSLTNDNMICVDCDVSNWLSEQKLQFVTKALVGYNFRTGDPMATVDMGMESQIFEAQAKSSSGCDIGRYDPSITLNENKACSSSLTSTIHKSFESLRKAVEKGTSRGGGIQIGVEADITLEASAGVGEGGSVGGSASYTVPPPFKNSWGESQSMKKAQQFFSSSMGSLVISEAECSLWVFQITHQTRLPMFTQRFKQALQKLNDANHKSCDEQQKAFKEFITDYGTHFFVHMTFGAKVSTVYEYSESATSILNDSDLKGCADKSMAIQLGVIIGRNDYSKSCSAHADSVLKGLTKGKVQFKQMTKGSVPVKDIAEWSKVEFTPVPTHFILSAMPNLLAKRHLKDQAGINVDGATLRKWFVPMYFKYCEAMGKDCTGTCDIAYCAKCSEDNSVCKQCEQGATGDGTTTCRRKVCPRLVIESATLTPAKALYVEGDVVAISCPTITHDLHGAVRLRCNSNLQWGGGVSECKPKFQCLKPNKLIPNVQMCDGNNDCGDCTDELENGCPKPCVKALFNAEQLKCHNGNIIDIRNNLCDGYNQCGDCTDELITYTLVSDSCRLRCTRGQAVTGGNTGDDSYCDNNKCYWGEGDCTGPGDCLGNLQCGRNNCQGMTGTYRKQFDATDDCCEGNR